MRLTRMYWSLEKDGSMLSPFTTKRTAVTKFASLYIGGTRNRFLSNRVHLFGLRLRLLGMDVPPGFTGIALKVSF